MRKGRDTCREAFGNGARIELEGLKLVFSSSFFNFVFFAKARKLQQH